MDRNDHNDWPFEDPRNVAVFTTVQVVRDRKPILWATRDEDDGAYQFHTGGPVSEADAVLVGLGNITSIDPSLFELADLPPGWIAWRTAVGEPWHRAERGK